MPRIDEAPRVPLKTGAFAVGFDTTDLTDSPEGSDAVFDLAGVAPYVVLSPTDGAANHTLLQAKLTAGEPIHIPRGRYPVTGALQYPSNASVRGWGCMSILEFDGASCFVPADLTDGAVSCQFENFTIDGGWTPAWGQDPATGTAIALYLLSDIDAVSTNSANSLANFGDNYTRVHNVHITNVAGRGLVIEGRGEVLVTNCNIVRCLTRGIDCVAFDMWFGFNSVSVCGQECMWIGRASGATGEQSGAAGNVRGNGNKFWFNGMSTFSQPAACVMIDSPAHSVSNWYGNDIQDTQGKALHLNGDGIVWYGSIDAPFRLNEWQGFGIAPDLTLPVLDVDDVRDSIIEISMTDRLKGSGVRADLNQRPLAFAGGATDNKVTLNLVQKTGETAWWDTSNVITNNSANRNVVLNRLGDYLLGQI